ncbi:hypothetical protein AGMMS50268_08760 [Spirochaetia bacterium]|nr:hypothetical protein AGMMS50268_08760 [Spirochaetia bacterium]
MKRREIPVSSVNHWTQLENSTPLLVIGTTENRRIQILLENAGVNFRRGPESLFLQWCDIPRGKALVIAGTDEAGLMYNLLELARRVEKDGVDALNRAENFAESPQNAVRCVDRYLLGHLDDEWFKSEEFWNYLLSRMARARFNRFCLILGFDTAYMSPPYPFFVESQNYPGVTVKGLTKEGREENLAALRRIGALCHRYGIKFVFATWQQRPWTTAQEQLVLNMSEDVRGLSAYCYDGLKDLIAAVPEIDIVQFRVNHESGVGDQVSAEEFWNHCADAVADVAAETGRPLILDLRAKGLTESMIAHAFSRGLPVEVPTKFWCEHAALPYHLSVMRNEELARLDNFNHSRRYSYADMLRKPRFYDVIYRLWNYGSTNLFLWGDADYARRFSLSCGLSGSTGFQINTPLSLKYGHELSHKNHWDTFVKQELRYGKWEDERFWMWYTAFGRLGYNPDTDPHVWEDEFAAHFGAAGKSLEKALAAASKIVPLVTTIHMPVHPSLRYWTEMNTGWALFAENNLNKPKAYDLYTDINYGSTEPSDHGLFYGINEYVQDLSAGKLAGKYSPLQAAEWLDQMAAETETFLAAAEGLVKDKKAAEYLAMRVDLLMLCDFARYHGAKIRAATALALWRVKKEGARLSDAALLLDTAIGYWTALAEKGRENYYHDLDFSSAGSETRRGTWGDLTCELLADRKTLGDMLTAEGIAAQKKIAASYAPEHLSVERHQLAACFPETAIAKAALKIEVEAASFGEAEAAPVLHYRHTDQTEGLFHTLEMERTARGYAAVIPAEYIKAEWDLQIYVTIQGASGACVMFPGIYHPEYPYPYHVISVKQ